MNNTQIQELSFKEKINKPGVKYGCLPALALFIIFLISVFTGNSKKIDFDESTLRSDIIVKDFCTLSIKELQLKYGEASGETQAGDSVYNWTLNKENNIRVMLFYNKEKREMARFFHLELGTYFWDTLGWDKGDLDTNTFQQVVYIRNLKGIDEAIYKTNMEVLDIKLKDDVSNFGKK